MKAIDRYFRGLAGAALAVGALAGCSDSPTGPDTPGNTLAPKPPPTSFDVTVRYVTNPSLRQRYAVEAAVDRWSAAIVGELADIPLNSPAASCSASQPAINETIDDLLLLVEFVSIDGAGKTLGEAGPCYIRMGESDHLPVMGYMRLDADDLRQLELAGKLDDVVLHELGHILGIGTLWGEAGLLTGAGTSDPLFTGTLATDSYRAIGGLDAGVPVENTGATGTRDGHWRESVFGSELMTGWIDAVSNPLSAMTIASLQDLGYGASLTVASSYTLGSLSRSAVNGIDMQGRERVHGPRFRVDKRGRKLGIGNPHFD